jgi:hypothetical protein
MTTITQKKKKSPLVWVFIIMIIVAIVIVAVLATLHNPDTDAPYLDLTPVTDAVLGFYMWASIDITNAAIATVGLMVAGALFYYIIIKYFVGQKVTVAQQTGYMPQGQTISQPNNSGNETVIS